MEAAPDDRIPAEPKRLPVKPFPAVPLPLFLDLVFWAETSLRTWAELSSATAWTVIPAPFPVKRAT